MEDGVYVYVWLQVSQRGRHGPCNADVESALTAQRRSTPRRPLTAHQPVLGRLSPIVRLACALCKTCADSVSRIGARPPPRSAPGVDRKTTTNTVNRQQPSNSPLSRSPGTRTTKSRGPSEAGKWAHAAESPQSVTLQCTEYATSGRPRCADERVRGVWLYSLHRDSSCTE